MPAKKKKKTTTRKKSVSAVISHDGLEMQTKLLLAISMIAVFMLGLVLTDMMSRAMAATILSSYQRQVSIGSEFDRDLQIETAVRTATFQQSGDLVTAVLRIPLGNIISYQLFKADQTPDAEIIDLNSFDCLHRIVASTLDENFIMVQCEDGASTLQPEPGDSVLARYFYIAGPSIYSPVCGNGIVEMPWEVCDDGALNGTPGNCNILCTGIASTTPTGLSDPRVLPNILR